MFGIVTAAAVTMLMQTDNASAAKKKIKQVNNSASTSLRKGVLTVSGKGKMTKKLIPTQAQKKKIKKIIIKKGITELPEEAFAGCNKAEEITISSSVRKIGMHAFSDTAVKDMVIPKTVKGIGWGICERCKQLESLTVPGNFKVLKPSSDKYYEPFVVGEYALKTVKFSTALEPELVRMVGDCEKFELQDSDPNYKSIDGMIYTKDGKIGEIALITEADKVIISSGVEKIRLNKKGYEKGLTPEYLFAIMCCEKIGKYTADRYTVTASTIPHFKEDFIRKMVVPILDSESINIITEKIKEAFSLLNKKKGLVLECQNQINSIIKI